MPETDNEDERSAELGNFYKHSLLRWKDVNDGAYIYI